MTSSTSSASLAGLARGLAVDSLYLLVLPTEQCNFRCRYCYEDFVEPRMSEAVVTAVEAFLSRRAASGLRQLGLSWFGGEPLLAVDLVIRMQRHAQALAASHPGLRLAGQMTTNGYRLTPALLEELIDAGVTDYQISIDGPAVSHDTRRPRADGKPTFARIWSNLLAIRELDRPFAVKLRVHVDPDNVAVLPSFLDELADHFANDERFTLYLREVSRLGGPQDATLSFLEGNELASAMETLRGIARRLGLRQQEGPGDPVCYASRVSSYVIRANGDLAKCTTALRNPRNRVGHLEADGSLRVDSDVLGAWTRGLWTRDAEALACPLVGIEKHLPGHTGLVQLGGRQLV